ncbi:MAG: VWA domain-containing protein [Vicinamibacteria bacterium]|nr:VWA domain-containing protein [Vicinamibacteria bacterium]
MATQLPGRRSLQALALFVAPCLFSPTRLAGQGVAPAAAPAAPLIIRVGVDLIQIDASVTDVMGRPAVDLRPEDFDLEVDGRKHVVTNAAYFGRIAPRDPAQVNRDAGATEAPLGGPKAADSARENSVVVFVIDDLNLSQEGMYRARRALQAFISTGGVGNALTAVRITSDERTSFTLFRSPDDFSRAVAAIRFTFKGSQGLGGRETGTDTGGVSQGGNGSKYLPEPVINPSQEFANIEQRVFSLITTINGLSSLPGRKAIVFVSEGFRDMRAPALVGADSPLGSIFRDSGNDATSRMITDLANRAFVVIYTADPRGMPLDLGVGEARPTTPLRGQPEGEASLWRLAAATGGVALFNRANQLGGGLSFVMRDQGSYYLIGFEPPPETFARKSGKPAYHAIRLTAKRKDLRVRTRAGFYGVTDRELAEPRRK